jgi:hypothetical protein
VILSCGFEANGADQRIEIIDDALVEVIELRPLLLVEAIVCADGAEQAGGQRCIDAFEQRQEDEADRVALRQELVSRELGSLAISPLARNFERS